MPTDALALVATELLANSIAVSPPDEVIEVRLRLDGEQVALSVTDRGRHDISEPEIRRAELGSVRGRGLHLVQSLSNRLVFERADGTTTVTALQYRKMLSMGEQAVPTGHREDGQ